MFRLGDYVRVHYTVGTTYDYIIGHVSYFDETWLAIDNKVTFPTTSVIFVKNLEE